MGFLFGFLCGVLFIPLSLALGVYWFFTYSDSYAEKRQEQLKEEQEIEKCEQLDLDDMPSALYASYLGQRNGGNGLAGYVPEHLDPQYQFAGWISVKRIPDVDHRIIEPSLKKETKKHPKSNNNYNNNGTRKGSNNFDGDERPVGSGVAGSMGAGAGQDPRFTYLDTQNPHLSLPPCLQSRFKDSKYAVIKGATMFIYENDHMEECLGVITIPNYRISVPGQQKDSHIFAKRNPIWLQYHNNHSRRSTAGSDGSVSSAKDYYLSMVSCVDKEDLYFTLLRCVKLKPNHGRSFIREIPKRDSTLFDKSAMNTLIRTIHSNEHQFQAAWLNALLGRMFLGIYKTPQMKEMVFQKLVEKLTRVRLPNFLNDMRMKSVHLGDGVPLITRPKLLTLKPNGDMIMDMSLLYQGGFRAEVEAEAVVTVTKKIQPIKVSLVLMMALLRLEGRMQVWIKPPPCNRIWYGFYHKPQVEMKIEPVVSDKHIKSNLIIKAIENKMLEAIAETMVLPNMDDIPFSDSEGMGGIFGEEISPGGEAAPSTPPSSSISQKSAPPKQPPSPGRSATINLVESPGAPRSAIDLGSDARSRGETLSANGLYLNMSGSRSHVSLGDELMQTNYSYDSKLRHMNPLDEDPMNSGSSLYYRTGQPLVDSPEEILNTVRPFGGEMHMPNRSEITPVASASTGVGSKLFHRKNAGSNQATSHNRRMSQDPSPAFASGAAVPRNSNSSQYSTDVRNMEEQWSTYGMVEYEPAALDSKSSKNKDNKKLKDKLKPERENQSQVNNNNEADHISLDSKDSAETGSTRNAGQSSIYGYSGSTEGGVSGYAASVKSDKFSLSKMFQGFRKRHTKGAHSGSSLLSPPPSNGSTGGLGHTAIDPIDPYSITQEDGEGEGQGFDPRSFTPVLTSGHLSTAYLPQMRQKFESTPNLSSLAGFSAEQDDGSKDGTQQPNPPPGSQGSVMARTSMQSDSYEFVPEAVASEKSPVGSIYAASLFGTDDTAGGGGGGQNDRSLTPTHPITTAHHSLLHVNAIGTAIRKLRNRQGGSGSSREELNIPPGDINAYHNQQHVLQQLQQRQQQHNSDQRTSSEFDGSSIRGPSMDGNESLRSVNGTGYAGYLLDTSLSSSGSSSRSKNGAPMIILQKASPYLTQGGNLSSPQLEGTPQYIPEHHAISQQPQATTKMRSDARELSSAAALLPGTGTGTGVAGAGTASISSSEPKPRRHSINHPPSVASNITGQYHASHLPYGLGMMSAVPASPLRREFTRREGSPSSAMSSSSECTPVMTGPSSFSQRALPSESSNNSTTTTTPITTMATTATTATTEDHRSRTNSETLSIHSTTSSTTSTSTTARDLQQQQQNHSSTLRNILSNLGQKNKKKAVSANGHDVAASVESPHYQQQSQPSSDSQSTLNMVSIVGVVAVSRSASVAIEGDPFSMVGCVGGNGGGVHKPYSSAEEQQQQRSTLWRSSEDLADIEQTTDILATATATTSTTTTSTTPTSPDSVKSDEFILISGAKPEYKKNKMNDNFINPKENEEEDEKKEKKKKEALHARPGYIGEYPTPVRMHSFLNREAKAILAEEHDHGHVASLGEHAMEKDKRRTSMQGQQPQRQQQSLQIEFHSQGHGGELVGTSSGGNSLPHLGNASEVALPLPTACKSGEEVPLDMSLQMANTTSSVQSSSVYTMVAESASSNNDNVSSRALISTMSVLESSALPKITQQLRPSQPDGQPSGSMNGSVMSRCEYDAWMLKKEEAGQQHLTACQGDQSQVSVGFTDCCEPLNGNGIEDGQLQKQQQQQDLRSAVNGHQEQKLQPQQQHPEHQQPQWDQLQPQEIQDQQRYDVQPSYVQDFIGYNDQQENNKINNNYNTYNNNNNNQGNFLLQPSAAISPTSAKKHRNLFKRLIRRKSEDVLQHENHQRRQHPGLFSSRPQSPTTPTKPQMYMQPGMAQSHSSVKSLGLFHFQHHHHSQQFSNQSLPDQQQQQQPSFLMNDGVSGGGGGVVGGDDASEPSDIMQGTSSTSSSSLGEFTCQRTQSSSGKIMMGAGGIGTDGGTAINSSSSSGSGNTIVNGTGGLSVPRGRPRSSTVSAIGYGRI